MVGPITRIVAKYFRAPECQKLFAVVGNVVVLILEMCLAPKFAF